MSTLTIEYAKGHPFWNRDQHGLFIDGKEISPFFLAGVPTTCGHAYSIRVQKDGIYSDFYSCSSGGGRRFCKSVKILDASQYGRIEWVGDKMEEFTPDICERNMLGPGFER